MKTPDQWLSDLNLLLSMGVSQDGLRTFMSSVWSDGYDEGVRVMYEKVTARLGVANDN